METSKKPNVPKVKGSMPKYNLYLSILHLIEIGTRPSRISVLLAIKKQNLNHYLQRLKDHGLIRKVGYGVWKATENAMDKVKRLDVGRSLSMSGGIKVIRSHGFGFYVKIPKIFRWVNREDYLKKENIPYTKDNLNQGQKFVWKGFHVFLFNKGIRLMQKEGEDSIFTHSAILSNEIAIRRVIEAIRSLERLFSATFSIKGQYNVKITRQHHALIKNELANLYNKENRKIFVFDEKGLWLLIDDSLKLDELETVRGSSADGDMDNVVKPFFNDLKEFFKETGEVPKFSNVMKIANQTVENQAFHEANIKSHVVAIQENTETAKEMRSSVPLLTDAVQKLVLAVQKIEERLG